MKFYYWLRFKFNLKLGNLFYPGLGKQGTWRYKAAIYFWSRSYGYQEEFYARLDPESYA